MSDGHLTRICTQIYKQTMTFTNTNIFFRCYLNSKFLTPRSVSSGTYSKESWFNELSCKVPQAKITLTFKVSTYMYFSCNQKWFFFYGFKLGVFSGISALSQIML